MKVRIRKKIARERKGKKKIVGKNWEKKRKGYEGRIKKGRKEERDG